MNRAAICLGSNIDPARNVQAALERIAAALHVLAKSRFIQTRPVGAAKGADFLNGVVLVETEMDKPALVEWLKGVEADLGRPRHGDRSGPRTIDLDVVIWNGQVVSDDVREREFLRPLLAEVLGELPS